MKYSDGFTLLELIVALGIISVIIVVVIPRISFDFGYMDSMSAEVLMDVRDVQMNSMKGLQDKYSIQIYQSSNMYYVKRNSELLKKVTFKDTYSIEYNNGNVITFNSEGTPLNAGTFKIKDTKTGKIKEITIVPATGRTIIKE